MRRHCASRAGGDSRIDRVHRNTPHGSAPWGDTALATGPLRLAVAAMPQKAELGPGHDDDRPSACRARRFAKRWQHLHRDRVALVEGRRLCQVRRPKARTRCRSEVVRAPRQHDRSLVRLADLLDIDRTEPAHIKLEPNRDRFPPADVHGRADVPLGLPPTGTPVVAVATRDSRDHPVPARPGHGGRRCSRHS